MKSIWRKVVVALAFAVLVGGCATTNALQNAQSALDKAKVSGAPEKAKLDYYMAQTYLEAAKKEVDEGDNDEARTFAAESEKYSGQAIQKAGGAK